MSLREYRRKRHFQRTPEPKGLKNRSAGRAFVVQKHEASHLHYDLRLELEGVLKSWAVPKGPCLDPSVKRLAIQVEDHPVEYGSFEGIIPQGEYGGGTVMLWDQGHWEPVDDPVEGYRAGKLKFKLNGQKLHGGWMLIRTAGKAPADSDHRQWLLFKERDDDAQSMSKGDVLEDMPLSVSTGRTMSDINADRDRVWGTKVKTNKNDKSAARSAKVRTSSAKASNAKGTTMPATIDVELATRADQAAEGDDWFHEVKFDGYRIICRLDDGHVKLISRNHKDWSDRFAHLADALRKLPVRQAILDGEIVALRADGISDFEELQNAAFDPRAEHLHYFIFDLLYLDGRSLVESPLAERKALLAEILQKKDTPAHVHLSEHIQGNGPAFLREACKNGLEGIVSKRRDRPYVPGLGLDWLKVKCIQSDEFVIGGYTDPAGARVGFGALLVGYHDAQGDLVYAGKIGTGYNERTLQAVHRQLQHLSQTTSPFKDLKRAPKGTHWVAPRLVAQVAFGSRTRDGILRHASFQGLREDKPAEDVTREKVVPLAKIHRRGTVMKKQNHTDIGQPSTSLAKIEYDAANQEFAGVRLTSPDKILYADQGITKLELANYYRTIADWMLPHIVNRPLLLVRCPNGREKDCFFQKHPAAGTPDTLRQVPIKEKTKTELYVVVDDVDGLVSLAQVGALEIHAWGSRADKLEQPDRLIFDLDPDPQVTWKFVVQSARKIRAFLQELGLESFVKTTGGKGLHLVVPVDRRHDWDEVRSFCQQVADLIVKADPRHYTATMAKAARSGKIFVDYLRNGRGATAIVPYSTRGRAGAPVSTPLSWEELSDRIHSDHYSLRNLPRRLASLNHDPWEGMAAVRQTLTGPIIKARGLFG